MPLAIFFQNTTMGHKVSSLCYFYSTKENLFILDSVSLVVGDG
jgi:hypothetical protein